MEKYCESALYCYATPKTMWEKYCGFKVKLSKIRKCRHAGSTITLSLDAHALGKPSSGSFPQDLCFIQ